MYVLYPWQHKIISTILIAPLSSTTLQFKLDVFSYGWSSTVSSGSHWEQHQTDLRITSDEEHSTQDQTSQLCIWRICAWAWMTAKTPLSKKLTSTMRISKALLRHIAFIDSSRWLAFKSIYYRTLRLPAVTVAQSNVLDLESACKNTGKTLNKVTSDVKDTLKRSEQGNYREVQNYIF